ncbi:tyrosine-type recombinase/integrase [Myroides odoratus]|uniref:tyrosine-type recombinase/integrase n=1 Tax=Myroides odoratus TaxID=256 RepID=UPI003342BC05
MAGITFLYRSKKDEANLTLRLRFSHSDIELKNNRENERNVDAVTKINVSKDYWYTVHNKHTIRDANKRNKKSEIDKLCSDLETYILNIVNKTDLSKIDKNWLKKKIELFYNPAVEIELPQRIYEYIDFYLDYRKTELSEANRKKYITLKGKIPLIEDFIGEEITFNLIDEKFRKQFEHFYIKNKYAQNTLQREFTTLKTLCSHSRGLGVHSNVTYDGLSFKKESNKDIIYLTKEELTLIKNFEFNEEHKYLEPSRDWLLISCFTGQRISDFMNFTIDTIKIVEGKELLQFKQKKTKKDVSVPIGQNLKEILLKNSNSFPKPVIDQVYNRHLKLIGELVGLDDTTQGKVVSTEIKGIKGPRKISTSVPKYDLLTSHIGRRTFATLQYGKMPTSQIKDITGHSTESMLLKYLGKNNTESALKSFEYINML